MWALIAFWKQADTSNLLWGICLTALNAVSYAEQTTALQIVQNAMAYRDKAYTDADTSVLQQEVLQGRPTQNLVAKCAPNPRQAVASRQADLTLEDMHWQSPSLLPLPAPTKYYHSLIASVD